MNFIRGVVDRSWGAFEILVVRSLRLNNRYPPLFLVGAPRSGTTVVYQHVVNRFRWAYFPNLSRRFPRACVTAAAVSRFLDEYRPTYESRFGEMEGVAAPSDGWEVFHRWYPRYDYTIPVHEARLHELRTIVRLLEGLYDAPFVNKNNSNSVRIPSLLRTFPNALFIHVSRDLPETVGSIIRGRRANAIARDEWWGAPPPQLLHSTFENPTERVVAQVWGLRERIDSDLAGLPTEQHMTVSYEDFCAHPEIPVSWIQQAYERQGTALVERGESLPSSLTARKGELAADRAFRRRVGQIAERLTASRRHEPGGHSIG